MGYLLVDYPNPYTAQGTYPRRGGNKLSGTCIVHTSEGAWTAGVDSLTNLVRNRTDYGCYHRACDWEDIAAYYPWEWECWQDSETNNWAVGIAAACRTTDWKIMPADVREGYYRNLGIMAADFVAYMRDQYGINVPLRRLSGAEARARVPGFAAHGDSGVSRSDPGADFDWNKFFAYTAQALTGSLTYASESITEDDMPSAVEVARAILDFEVDQVGKGQSGKINLGSMLSEYRHNNNMIVEATVREVAPLLNQGPATIAAQIDAAGLASAVRDELVKLLEGK